MKFIIIHRNKKHTIDNGNLLRFAISSNPIASIILEGLNRNLLQNGNSSLSWRHNGQVICAIPKEWKTEPLATTSEIIHYSKDVLIYSDIIQRIKQKPWFIVANGGFATQVKAELLNKVLDSTDADVLAVNAEPHLLAYHEKVRLTTQNKIAGFRRCYLDSIEPAIMPQDWPHYIFIKNDVLNQVLINNALPESFSAFLERCRLSALTIRAIKVAGVALDLETEEGLLNCCSTRLSKIRLNLSSKILNSNTISRDSKLVGKVLLGKNVHIDPKAIIIGPTIIGSNVKIKQGAVINSSIIGPGVCVPRNQLVQNRIVTCGELVESKGTKHNWNHLNQPKNVLSRKIYYSKHDFNHQQSVNGTFHTWSRFSYARSFKRIADFLAAIFILILFAPIVPFIALAIKLSSPGPVFFKDKRQGLLGREFYCLKFRSMKAGADKLQNKLRLLSQVDGPQFKMTNDPRLSAVGQFLRDTNIDEIPQFINVLLGQMSVIGPRPSPKSENTLCPFWHDTRLSVRPGITGLWQICRTRQSMKDFQEWIHYDTKYVKELSLKLDLWICWQTTKELVSNFVRKF